MNIIKLISDKTKNKAEAKTPVIAFLGDSVTQGCFEIYRKSNAELKSRYDKSCAYHNYIARIFNLIFPESPITIINAGVGGDTAAGGLKRLERDVLAYKPDLTVVCFGLNDCGNSIELYTESLRQIFIQLKNSGSEVIFMTPNMMNTSISCHTGNTKDSELICIASKTLRLQADGIMDRYIDAAKRVASEYDIPICDVYKKWKTLAENNVDTTELLANKINHPIREMNWLFAYSLIETMMQ